MVALKNGKNKNKPVKLKKKKKGKRSIYQCFLEYLLNVCLQNHNNYNH